MRLGAWAAAACLFATAAHADGAAPLAGIWAFETGPQRNTACVITGQAVVRPRTRADEFDVSLQAEERCPDGHVWRADEACTARRAERALRVACTLVHALPYDYRPDQFLLAIESVDLMRGRLIDEGAWNEPVRWRRTSGALVS